MSKTLNIQELAIVVIAKNLNPTALNLDFLRYSGIVPDDWELVRAPVYTNTVSQVLFQSRVGITAQPDKIIFSELISTKEPSEVNIPEIARKYTETLPRADYQAIGINFRGHAVLGNTSDAAHKYMIGTLLSSGSWKDLGKEPVKASVQLVYTLDHAQLNLSVNEAMVQLPEQKTLPVVLFSGNFGYPVAGNSQEERLSDLYQALNHWQIDLETYRDLINTRFLNSVEFKNEFTGEEAAFHMP